MNDAPLTQNEIMYFRSLEEVSKNYTGLKKQYAQYEMIIKRLEDIRKKIQKGEISLPLYISIIPGMEYAENNKKKALEFIDEQLKSYKNALKAINGQIEHRKEEFLETGARTRDWLNKRFTNEIKALSNDRRSKEKEEVLFESEFEELLKSASKQKEFKKAVKTAKAKNAKRGK